MQSIYDMYKQKWNDNWTEEDIFGEYDSSDVEKQRKTVITMHNSKSYQVDGMTNEYSPLSYSFFDKKTQSKMSMSEYFKKAYNVNLRDKQPLLYVNNRDGRIYLPSQLCHEASLPEDFTRDQFKMRAIQDYKIAKAQTRRERIIRLAAKFADDETFNEWKVSLN